MVVEPVRLTATSIARRGKGGKHASFAPAGLDSSLVRFLISSTIFRPETTIIHWSSTATLNAESRY